MKLGLVCFIMMMAVFLLAGCDKIEMQKEPVVVVDDSFSAPVDEPPVLQEQPEPVVSCEEWAISVFPEQWVYAQTVTNEVQLARESLVLIDGKWKDGSVIRGTSFTKVAKGSLQGENINYYYAKPMYPGLEEKYAYAYSEDVIDQQGTILGKNAFSIRPYFRVIADLTEDENNTQGYPVKTRYLSLVMVEPNMLSCERYILE
ncbi:hypothetical protein JXB28_03065 [Candidatus Woesearchaeota archaeon]|nr:hypothetical protein [Candidatus Woesearchaeota archaeon]